MYYEYNYTPSCLGVHTIRMYVIFITVVLLSKSEEEKSYFLATNEFSFAKTDILPFHHKQCECKSKQNTSMGGNQIHLSKRKK